MVADGRKPYASGHPLRQINKLNTRAFVPAALKYPLRVHVPVPVVVPTLLKQPIDWRNRPEVA
jgi:hypothetical protein